MKTYYYATVSEASAEGTGYPVWHVTLTTASEDGYQTYATLKFFWEEKRARDVAAFWTTGGHEMVMALLGAEIEWHEPDYPDPSDIAEMEAEYHRNLCPCGV